MRTILAISLFALSICSASLTSCSPADASIPDDIIQVHVSNIDNDGVVTALYTDTVGADITYTWVNVPAEILRFDAGAKVYYLNAKTLHRYLERLETHPQENMGIIQVDHQLLYGQERDIYTELDESLGSELTPL